MARNTHPEETINKILDVSLALFFEKGYDNTSVQDIIDNLGGLTKGAVYHHFKAKEDILSAALDRDNARIFDELRAIRDDEHMNGAEKFQALLEASISGPQLDIWAKIAPTTNPIKNSRLFSLQYQAIFTETVPFFIEPIMLQGVADGSIKTEHPRYLAEILVLLANFWAGPMFHESPPEEFIKRIEYYRQIASVLGINLSDNGMTEKLNTYVSIFNDRTQCFDDIESPSKETESP